MSTNIGGRLKDGYLVKSPDSAKQLHQLKKWQRKWFRLHDNGDLHYYNDEKSSKPSGVIPLLQLYRIFDAKTMDLPLSYCVGLEGAGKSYLHYLKADSADSFNAWLKVLRGFAEMVEVSFAEPSGSPSTSRRGTFSSDFGQSEDERLRSGSTTSNMFNLTQNRHLSVSTKAKFNKKEGWMAKTGSNNKGWKDRYFKLSNGKLSYYKSDKADTLQGEIDLFECTGVVKTSGKKAYGFDIEVPGRMYNLSTESELEQNEWMTAISFTLGVISELKDSPMIPRSGSNSSNVSEVSLGGTREVQVPHEGSSPGISGLQGHDRLRTTSSGETESPLPSGWSPLVTSAQSAGGRKEDSVVQLLEAEVEALRRKVSSLESEVQASTSANSQLQEQLVGERREWEQEARALREERETLTAQVEQLMISKEELETVNDSLQTQLEEHIDQVQVLQEEQVSLRHDLDDSNASTLSAEEDVKVYQQEITEMQHKLLEIEDVAKELQTALIKKGEDPETPIIARKFNSLTSSLGSPLADCSPDRTFPRVAAHSVKLQHTLEAVEKERDSLKEELTALRQAESGSDAESSLSEEKLKRQMEMANLRKECEAKLEEEREKHSQETAELKAKVVTLEETCTGLRERSKQEISEMVQNLSDSKASITRLEEEVSSYKERVGQLQTEKEKALTDLNAIRKINRSMEKKMSEGDVDARTLTPCVSPIPPVQNGTSPESPGLHQRLLDAEKSNEEVKALLREVELERDQLKTQLERLLSGMQNGVPGPDMDVHDISRFGFITKTRASTAASNKSLSDPTRARSFTGAADMLQLAYQNCANGNDLDNPPPKPRRPPRDLYQTQVQSDSEQHQQQEIRPRSKSFLQSLFGRH